jgi:hypothetical protein
MFDLSKIGQHLTENDLWDLRFSDFDQQTIEGLCLAVAESMTGGHVAPYINERQELIIPFNTHPIFKWWTPGGQPVRETLKQLNAPPELFRRYCHG